MRIGELIEELKFIEEMYHGDPDVVFDDMVVIDRVYVEKVHGVPYVVLTGTD
jgi:hypothetical protein